MVTEKLGTPNIPRDTPGHRSLEAHLNPIVNPNLWTDRARRIMGPAACAIASDELHQPLFDEADTPPDGPGGHPPNSRVVTYTSDENGWDIQFFETDENGVRKED